MNKFLFRIVFTITMIVSLGFSALGVSLSLAAPAPHVKVDVCHATGSETNPYVLINVNVNSVGAANDLNGHAGHGDDAWEGFTYGGVFYPGQGDMSNCSSVPTTCTQAVDGTPGEWSDWVDNGDGTRTRTRTIPLLDANDGSNCGSRTETQTEGTTTPPTTDLCSNIEGVQTSTNGLRVLEDGTCREQHVFVPIPCPTCGPPVQEILNENELMDMSYNNGNGCYDYFRVKKEAKEDGIMSWLAERMGRLISLKWGTQCDSMHTVSFRSAGLPAGHSIVLIDTNGDKYPLVGHQDWDGLTTYSFHVQLLMPYWDEEDLRQAALRVDQNGNQIPVVNKHFEIRGKDSDGNLYPFRDFVLKLDPTQSAVKSDPVACSVYPNSAFQYVVGGQKFILKWYGMTESDFVLLFRDMGWTNQQINFWLENDYRPAAIGDLVPVPEN